ncbi:HAD family hydrolase [Halomarina litorea]|uniref:HAD family hydrolase n=1 Tax=Halomarina litorea TaxID=2961595 RepID=UPI0020C430EA|nr:HAD family hydrolase [Halomarina sp. BCD28]
MSERTAVCFDLDGTLLRLPDYESVLTGAFEDRLGRSEARWVDRYGERFFSHFEALAPDPYRRAMADVCAAFDLDADPSALAEALVARECREATVPSGVRETLDALADGARLGVVTNGVTAVQRAKLAHTGLLDPFGTVVTSYDAGAHKPDPAPFDAAREALPADRYVMVGDDAAADVEGARAAGFEAVHVEGAVPGPTRILAGDR